MPALNIFRYEDVQPVIILNNMCKRSNPRFVNVPFYSILIVKLGIRLIRLTSLTRLLHEPLTPDGSVTS